jgi:hypothetical protein
LVFDKKNKGIYVIMEKMFLNSYWGEVDLPAAEPLLWRFGTLHLWCKKENDELWFANKYVENQGLTENELPPPPDDAKWVRYSLSEDYKKMIFRPMLPNRPLVIKVEAPFLLKKGARARIFMRVPLWIKIEIQNKTRMDLLELPTVVLSNTWFGTPTDGELCYWISSGARRIIEPDPDRPYMAICAMEVINRADEDLLVDKLCFRVEYLSLFSDGSQLWSNLTKIYFRGASEVSEIDGTGKAPTEAGSAKKISEPREDLKKSFTHRTFSVLKELTDLF